MPIRQLPPLLVNQIAAGEVIERPASVVKELVENSLDAGASRIDVAIEDGGKQLIRVSDDGAGIPEAELPLAVAPHATSKLWEPAQLAAVTTLGFRGEALASIASVSRLRLTSRARVGDHLSESAAVLEASGDEVSPVAPAAAAPGTVIEIRDLFFNTPARRKFLRGASAEIGHITDIVSRIAMARPDVAFTLQHNGRSILELAAADRRRRCVELLGEELDEGLLECERLDHGPEGAALWALVAIPAIGRATAKAQFLFVNGRPIRDRGLLHAIKEAYRGLMPPDRQPVGVVFIHLDPSLVDVNVHPAKSEVRFREPSRIYAIVLSSLRQRLLGTDLTPRASITAGATTIFNAPAFAAASDSDDSATTASDATAQAASPSLAPSPPPPHSPATAAGFVEYFRRMDPQQRGFVYEQVKQAYDAEQPQPLLQAMIPQTGSPAPTAAPGQPAAPDAWTQAQLNAAAPPRVLREHGVLQVHKSYLITQDDQGILIVDQHALHERVIFEELKQRVLARPLESQRLLMPAVLRANPQRQALLDPLRPLLEKIGIDAQPFGRDTIAIHAFPSLLFERNVEPVEFMSELLDLAQDDRLPVNDATAQEAALHEVLDMMACKAAIKAGDQMTPEELAALLARRDEIERASNCPHGRPTTIRLTLRDLEKQFKRT
jgi:DNA mismatch repair protein MutL